VFQWLQGSASHVAMEFFTPMKNVMILERLQMTDAVLRAKWNPFAIKTNMQSQSALVEMEFGTPLMLRLMKPAMTGTKSIWMAAVRLAK